MLTVKMACGHDWTGPTPATAEETAAAINTWRARACDNDDCRPYATEFAVARNRTDDEQRLRKREPVRVLTGIGTYKAPASHGARFYHGGSHVATGCTIIQVDGDSPTYQARILERAGATLLTGSVRAHLKPYLRSGVSTTTTLMLASTWIDGNVERDHLAHTCPDCGKNQGRCDDLACSTPVLSYRCSACYEAWYARERETADERRHTLHACSECGDLNASMPCTFDVDHVVHSRGGVPCGACHKLGSRIPVSIMADKPFEHCPEDSCAAIVPSKGDLCNYHATIKARSPAAANDDAPAHVKEDAWPPAVRAAAYAAYTSWPPAARAVGIRA